MQYLRLLLLPFSWVYGFVVWLRNLAYDAGIYKSQRYTLPVISIGNLAVGGAGKSPMAEYVVRLLKDQNKVAVLSRGYGRKTRGFRLVSVSDTAELAGDEPLQFRKKFSDVTVAVSEKRTIGIETLQCGHDVIIMDDAFQHRAVRPGLSILLFDYTRLNELMLVLPAGNLREPFGGRKRADVLVVTKTPGILSKEERHRLHARLRPFRHQSLFFSYLDYGDLVPLYSGNETGLRQALDGSSVFLITGIANPKPLLIKLRSFTDRIKHYDYPDHHPFTTKNIAKLAEEFKLEDAEKKLILTTEKDAQRLKAAALTELLSALPVYYVPVQARIHEPDQKGFDHLIERYVSEHLQYNGIH